MAGSGWPVKKNAARDFYGVLPSQADATVFKTTPTLASGDFKLSGDGGTLTNLATLPTVTPASGAQVLYALSQSELNIDHGGILSHDAAGAEWFDTYIPIETSTRQIDDLAYPAVSGRSLNVSASGLADSDVVNWKGSAAPAMTGDAYARVALTGFKKNTAFNGYAFPMFGTSNHTTPLTGLAVTGKRAIDAAAFAALGAVTEIGTSGWYWLNYLAADLNGDSIGCEFTAAGADPVTFTIKTVS